MFCFWLISKIAFSVDQIKCHVFVSERTLYRTVPSSCCSGSIPCICLSRLAHKRTLFVRPRRHADELRTLDLFGPDILISLLSPLNSLHCANPSSPRHDTMHFEGLLTEGLPSPADGMLSPLLKAQPRCGCHSGCDRNLHPSTRGQAEATREDLDACTE